ncbi:hypothetical protein LAZ67_4002006, partial [Cordylochernes scorpioides]
MSLEATNLVWAGSPHRAEHEPGRLGFESQAVAEISADNQSQDEKSRIANASGDYANLPFDRQHVNFAAACIADVTPSTSGALAAATNWAEQMEAAESAEDGFTVVKHKRRRRESPSRPVEQRSSGVAASRRTGPTPRRRPPAGGATGVQMIRATQADIADARARQRSSTEDNCVFVEHCPDFGSTHYLQAVEELVGGAGNVLQVMKMDGHMLVGLSTKALAERLIRDGLDIGHTHLRAFPFKKRAERITVGNLPFFVDDAAVIEALKPYGDVTSIVPIRLRAGRYTFTDGRREAFILLKEGIALEKIPTRVVIRNKGNVLSAFISYGVKCSRCGRQGHRRANCPIIPGRASNNGQPQPAPLPPGASTSSDAVAPPSKPMEIAAEVLAPPTSNRALQAMEPTEAPADPRPPASQPPGEVLQALPASVVPPGPLHAEGTLVPPSPSSLGRKTRPDLEAFLKRNPGVSFAGTGALGLGWEEVLDLLSSKTKARKHGQHLTPPQSNALAGLINQILDLRPGVNSNIYKVLRQVLSELRTGPAAVPPTSTPPAPRPSHPTPLTSNKLTPALITPPPPAPTEMEEDVPMTEEERCVPPLPAPRLAEPTPPTPQGQKTTPATTTPPLPLPDPMEDDDDLMPELDTTFNEMIAEPGFGPLLEPGISLDAVMFAILYREDRLDLLKDLSPEQGSTLAGFLDAALERTRNSHPTIRRVMFILQTLYATHLITSSGMQDGGASTATQYCTELMGAVCGNSTSINKTSGKGYNSFFNAGYMGCHIPVQNRTALGEEPASSLNSLAESQVPSSTADAISTSPATEETNKQQPGTGIPSTSWADLVDRNNQIPMEEDNDGFTKVEPRRKRPVDSEAAGRKAKKGCVQAAAAKPTLTQRPAPRPKGHKRANCPRKTGIQEDKLMLPVDAPAARAQAWTKPPSTSNVPPVAASPPPAAAVVAEPPHSDTAITDNLDDSGPTPSETLSISQEPPSAKDRRLLAEKQMEDLLKNKKVSAAIASVQKLGLEREDLLQALTHNGDLCQGYSAVVAPATTTVGSGLACVFAAGVVVHRQQILWPDKMAVIDLTVRGISVTCVNAHVSHAPEERCRQLQIIAALAREEGAWILGDLNISEESAKDLASGLAESLAELLDQADLVDVATFFDAALEHTRVATIGSRVDARRLDRILLPSGFCDRVTQYQTVDYAYSDHRAVLIQVGDPAPTRLPCIGKLLRSDLFVDRMETFIDEISVDLANLSPPMLWEKWTRIKANLVAEIRSLAPAVAESGGGYIERASLFLRRRLEDDTARSDYPSLSDLGRSLRARRRSPSTFTDDDGNAISGGQLRRFLLERLSSRFAQAPSSEEAIADFLAEVTPLEFDEWDQLFLADISRDQIAAAIHRLPNGRASGWDGLPCEFVKAFEDFFAEVLWQVFEASRLRGALPPSSRRSKVILLPKVHGGPGLQAFRPISLPTTDYRVLSGVLMARLRRHLPDLVPQCQTYAVPGRSSSWNIARMSDEAAGASRHDTPLADISLDLKSAFDTLSRSYLFALMEKLGLPSTFLGWIAVLYGEADASIRVGDVYTKAFPLLNGVRQGCRLSAALFSIGVGPLLRRLERTLGLGNVVAYADDIVLFIRDDAQFELVPLIFEEFRMSSGVAINFKKSCGLWCGSWKHRTDSPLGISWTSESLTILGCTITTRNTVASQASHLMGLMERAIARWSPFTRGLSLVGRARAANSLVLGSILHHLHGYLPPETTIGRLQARLARFVWGTSRVSWLPGRILARPDSDGGVGLLDIAGQLQLACLKGVQASLRGAANGYSWLVRSRAWLTPPAPDVWHSPRRRRLLSLWEAASSVLELDHRILHPASLRSLRLRGDNRFLRPPDLLAPVRWLQATVGDFSDGAPALARSTRAALLDAHHLGAFCQRLLRENASSSYHAEYEAETIVLRGSATPITRLPSQRARRALDSARLQAHPTAELAA